MRLRAIRRSASVRMGGFTLVEVAAVLVIMAILATAAVGSLAGARRRATLDDVTDRFASFDRQTREQARRFGRSETIVFDVGAAKVTRFKTKPHRVLTDTLELPEGFAIADFRLQDRNLQGSEVSVTCSCEGYTPTYAIEMRSARGDSRWLIVSGMTGEVTRSSDDKVVQELFAKTLAPRDDPG